MAEPHKILLPMSQLPKAWLNPGAVLAKVRKEALQPKNPPGADRLAEMEEYWAPSLLTLERSTAPEATIPTQVMDLLIYAGRPTPLQRAYRLEAALKTPAKIYYKREDIQYGTTDKTNAAIPKAFMIAKDGFNRVVGGGGAQWGTALSIAARYQDLKLDFYMAKESLESKEPHCITMQTNGAVVHGSPSEDTLVGKQIAKESPGEVGSLSTALSEATGDASSDEKAAAAFANFFNTPILFQSISGLEAESQFRSIGRYPDIVVGSLDGFAGFALPFISDKVEGKKKDTRFVVAGSKHIPAVTEGKLDYDHPDYGGLMPLYRFHSLGCKRSLPLIHAGEMRHHGVSPFLSGLVEAGLVTAKLYSQTEVFEAATTFARSQGIIPSFEAQYAIKAVIDEALRAKSEGKEEVIAFSLCGHSMLEHKGYLEYLIQKKLEIP